ncbi:MAG: Gfo/Idh/MocA family oxidoreductase [Flavobacteriales bacterium]|nr:Gfo/Idh/MocA family oxidoreductase [Flavobacteriales bacterium]
MDQLTQNLKDGKMELMEVPFPALKPGCVLVRTHFSVISAGTEGKTVKDARLSYIGKARSREEEVNKVIQSAKTHGVMKTYRMVMNKLEAPNPLGYSSAGEVIAVASDVTGFQIGDRVACGGNTANHSEVVCIPTNLCARIGDNTTMEDAAFTTIASIAMQGVRQAELNLGETCAVIGLGLIGQMTFRLLQASGVKPIGIDIDQSQVKNALDLGCDFAYSTSDEGIIEKIKVHTNGAGVDAVIITAGTSSTEPVNLAGEIARQKAKVVIVGAVNTGFTRKNYFKKELDLRMSCSYGPGRYNSNYEEKGLDYPIGYVRWTEQRNMQSYLDLLASGNLNITGLITHRFDYESAKDAYQLILDKTDRFAGITLKYNVEKELVTGKVTVNKLPATSKLNVGFIGAGSFAQNFLLPNLQGQVQFIGVCTARPNSGKYVADKYGFEFCTGDAAEIIGDERIDTVFIATRHDSHFQYASDALNAGKNVFLEKPMCLNFEELLELQAIETASKGSLMLGFNRRFSPLIVDLKKQLDSNLPIAINYRINAGIVPADHWVHDPKVGGGRILGEACHFIDLCYFLAGSPIKSISAKKLDNGQDLQDTAVIIINFENGSVASVNYFSNGNKGISKEKIEVFSNGVAIVIDDFKSMEVYGAKTTTRKAKQDKGHAKELELFVNSLKEGKAFPISFEDSVISSKGTFMALASLRGSGINCEFENFTD